MEYNFIKIKTKNKLGLVTLNRPKSLNALNAELIKELNHSLQLLEKDKSINCILLFGHENFFSVGADIKEMVNKDFLDLYYDDLFEPWEYIARCKKPIIAVVSGLALGGGCELAMMCDFIISSETAKYGQPETNIGTIPAVGGTQRLTLAVGKSKAMDLVLTGRYMDAFEAEKMGLVSRVVPANALVEEAIKAGESIAQKSVHIVSMAKESINNSFEMGLQEGLLFERRIFNSTFSLEDRKEGMNSFIEKRIPNYKKNS